MSDCLSLDVNEETLQVVVRQDGDEERQVKRFKSSHHEGKEKSGKAKKSVKQRPNVDKKKTTAYPDSPSDSDERGEPQGDLATKLTGLSPKPKRKFNSKAHVNSKLVTVCKSPERELETEEEYKLKITTVLSWLQKIENPQPLLGYEEDLETEDEIMLKKKPLEKRPWPNQEQWKKLAIANMPHTLKYSIENVPIKGRTKVAKQYFQTDIPSEEYKRIKDKPVWQWKTFNTIGKVIIDLEKGEGKSVRLVPKDVTGPLKDPRRRAKSLPPHKTLDVAPPWPEPKGFPPAPPLRSVIVMPEATRRKHAKTDRKSRHYSRRHK